MVAVLAVAAVVIAVAEKVLILSHPKSTTMQW